ncbi:transposase [Acidithiobacillus thiooxidans]|nr:transposase [Acidithiobacillus thiooxidans]
MAMNRVQFQKGLSLPDFLQRFGTEEQCATALESARWSDGFHCPQCEGTRHSVLKGGSRKTFQCSHCRHQTWGLNHKPPKFPSPGLPIARQVVWYAQLQFPDHRVRCMSEVAVHAGL